VLGTGTDQTATQLISGTWPDQTVDTQYNTLTTDWQLFVQSLSIPPTLGGHATSQIAIEFSYTPSGTPDPNDYIDVGLISLQTDYSPPVNDIRPYWLETFAAQRRFQKSFPAGTPPAQNTGSIAGAAYVQLSTGLSGGFGTMIPFQSRMRDTPTITTYNPSASNSSWRDVTNNADRAVTSGSIGDSGFRLDGGGGATVSQNYIHWTADAELT